MKVYKIVLSIILLLSFLVACSQPSDEEIYYKVQKKLSELESYECIAKITIADGEEIKEYIYKHYFKSPDNYRLELLSPESVKGNLMVSNGKMAWIYSPSINHTYRIDSIQKQQKEVLFIGFFIKNYLSSKESTISSEKLQNEHYVVITTNIPGGNYYFSKQRVWVNSKKIIPTQLHILDAEDRVRFKVEYEDFKYNPTLDNSIFHLKIE